jgi:hypothetical protein
MDQKRKTSWLVNGQIYPLKYRVESVKLHQHLIGHFMQIGYCVIGVNNYNFMILLYIIKVIYRY